MNRVVVNPGGNKYRLVVKIPYQASSVWAKAVGMHTHHDSIDAETVTIKPIRNDHHLHRAFTQFEPLFQAENGSPEADERKFLVTLIEAHANKHDDLDFADPVEAIKFRIELQGLTMRDLGP